MHLLNRIVALQKPLPEPQSHIHVLKACGWDAKPTKKAGTLGKLWVKGDLKVKVKCTHSTIDSHRILKCNNLTFEFLGGKEKELAEWLGRLETFRPKATMQRPTATGGMFAVLTSLDPRKHSPEEIARIMTALNLASIQRFGRSGRFVEGPKAPPSPIGRKRGTMVAPPTRQWYDQVLEEKGWAWDVDTEKWVKGKATLHHRTVWYACEQTPAGGQHYTLEHFKPFPEAVDGIDCGTLPGEGKGVEA